MLHLATIKGTLTLTGIAAGSVALAQAAPAISGQTNISISEAVAVSGVVVLGAWWLSSRLQKIDDRLKRIEEKQAEAKENTSDIARHDTRLGKIEEQIGIANNLAKI